MAKDDLMAHAALDVDFYALLDVQFESSASDIRRAYRKTALKYHPDKLGAAFDPEKFHLLQIANDVLSDEAAKAAYDQRRAAKIQKERAARLFEGRRRTMKEELEARERGAASQAASTGKRRRDEENEMEAEIRRLAEEGKRRRMEAERKMRAAESASRQVSTPPPPVPAETPKAQPMPASQQQQQSPQEEAAEEDEVARLERRIREIAEEKARKKAEKKARKSGIFTPSDSPAPAATADWKSRVGSTSTSKTANSTPIKRPDLADAKLAGKPISSPKFSFSPKPRVAPPAERDEFAKTMERLKEAEKRRLEDEIRRQEAEAEKAS